MPKKSKKVAVLDCETDPFQFGRVPKPFCCEFYAGPDREYIVTWGENCVAEMANALEKLDDEYVIFAHNGGKFDFHFFRKYLDNPIAIISARIVKAKMFHHTVQDSYSIMPVPLRNYKKMEFDYSYMERGKREKKKRVILEYLHDDCINLYEMCVAFVDRFGVQLTVGATALKELKKLHEFEKLSPDHDAYFRPFYFGGRVQCFKSGILQGPWKMFDVNSMYPKAMRDFIHPVGGVFDTGDTLPESFDNVFFLKFRGRNKGAIPKKVKNADGYVTLDFNVPEGEFECCSHELEVALKYGLVEIDEVIECSVSLDNESFADYVDKFYAEKVSCKRGGDKIGELFAKFMLNSAYGKFGQNPENFSDYKIVHDIDETPELIAKGFHMVADFDDFEIWGKAKVPWDRDYNNVAVAASITSAARAIMLEGLQNAVEPIYCDTDSLICREFKGDVSATTLGAWKFEMDAENCAIGGKKLYALYNDRKEKPLKLTSKGGTLTLPELLKICKGETVQYQNDAPTFSIARKPSFVTREFRSTISEIEFADDLTEIPF